MRTSMRLAPAIVASAASILLHSPAVAIDLTGAWVTDLQACDKVFAMKRNATTFRQDSDMFGSGFIVDGNRIRGRAASCTIKHRKEDGSLLHMIAGCATDIMLSTVQFSAKMDGDNKLTRIFPGIEGMELTYYRCPAPAAATR